MRRLIYICCILLAACNDDQYLPTGTLDGQVVKFEASVVHNRETRAYETRVSDNAVTKDFKPGDSFGLFIIDGDGHFVSTIEGKSAKNLKLTTPDGKAWNLHSDLKEVVHKLGYKYVAYYPYSEAFNDCASTADIQNLFTAPPPDQSAQEAIDWMFTDPTDPQVNAVTTLQFRHRYAKIDIYHSFTQEHTCNWTTAYLFTKTVDENQVEHYRYLLDAPSSVTLSLKGKYSIGNDITGMKEFSYQSGDIDLKNGEHAIVYTYRMDERCAVDLGLPSGIKWSPVNLGTETGTYMTDTQIAAVAGSTALGKRLAWGELFEKDAYSYATYINDPYLENNVSLLPSDIAGTVYDPAKQYWGGHWTLPAADDIQELLDYTEVVRTETVHSDELDKDLNRITLRSTRNGREITFLTGGYATNSTVSYSTNLYYMSANLSGYAYCHILNDKPSIQKTIQYRYLGFNIRPVLKELHIFSTDEKKEMVAEEIDALAVDLGITKTVTEIVDGVEQQVTYKLLWSPFNYGAEAKVSLQAYNGKPIDKEDFIDKCKASPGMRLAWGDTEERGENEKFSFEGYANSEMATDDDYNQNNSKGTGVRNLKDEDDIVYLNWPEGWSIPTAKDFELLCNNTTVEQVTDSNGKYWFRLTAKNGSGNSIMIPATGYIDNKVNNAANNNYAWSSAAYLQSSTMGPSSSSVTGDLTQKTVTKRTIYALNITGTTAKVVNSAGRPTGLMVRPVKYVRVE